MTKPRDYCPFTQLVIEKKRTAATQLANAVLCSGTYSELRANLRKLDAVNESNMVSYTDPDCEVFELAKGEWIPMRHLHKLATTFLDKRC